MFKKYKVTIYNAPIEITLCLNEDIDYAWRNNISEYLYEHMKHETRKDFFCNIPKEEVKDSLVNIDESFTYLYDIEFKTCNYALNVKNADSHYITHVKEKTIKDYIISFTRHYSFYIVLFFFFTWLYRRYVF